MTKAKAKAAKKSDHGAGVRGGEMFKFDPYKYIIIGLDTKDGPEHPLYDERIRLPVPDGLVKNIAYYGVLKPVIFERIPGDDERVLVIDGRQRIRAARMVLDRQRAAGEVEIAVRGIPQKGDGARMLGIARAANIHQSDGAMTNARNAQRMLDINGGDAEAVAIAFGVTKHTLEREWLPLLGLTTRGIKAVESGAMSPTAGARLARLPKDEQDAKLAEITAGGAKPTAAAVNNKVREASGKEPIETPRGKLTRIGAELDRLDKALDSKDGADTVTVLLESIGTIRTIVRAA